MTNVESLNSTFISSIVEKALHGVAALHTHVNDQESGQKNIRSEYWKNNRFTP